MITLTPSQRTIVETDGHVLALAGPGSGKTRIAVAKIEHLVRTKQIEYPFGILAVTFSDTASRELRARIHQHVPLARDVVWCGTFHGFGTRVLRSYGSRIGVAEDFVVADSVDTFAFREAVLRIVPTLTNSQLKDQIEEAKRHDVYPGDRGAMADDADFQTAYAAYQQELRAANMLDFSDLVALGHRLLVQHPDVLELVRNKFRYVIADEFQDTDALQLEMMALITRPLMGSLIVADDDQAIFEWRGAQRANVREVATRLGCAQFPLVENHRSGRAIVEAASAVIAYDLDRTEKRLTSALTGGRILGKSFGTPDEEATAILAAVEEHLVLGVAPHEIAIISRARYRNDSIVSALRRLSVPWFDRGALTHHDSWDTSAALALAQLSGTRDDSVALALLVHAMDQSGLVDDGLEYACKLRSALGEIHVARFVQDVRAIRQRSGLETTITRYAQASERRRVARNLALLEADLATQLDAGSSMHRAITCILGEGAVQFCSGHAVKGREFDIVFLMGLEDDILPSYRSHRNASQLSQERRVFYVALTRARREVRLSYAHTRRSRSGGMEAKTGSRFLAELPSESIQNW